MTPTIELLPHNEKLYSQIREQIEAGERSIFYSEATGLGKSFIFMRLVQDYFVGKKILYIVPKIAIWENLTHYDEFKLLDAEVVMSTFAAFNVYDSNDGRCEEYDAVFVDECHHMLSDIQGDNVYKLLCDMKKSGKYVFGLTATPRINNVFVDEEYFDVSCYGYDVFEAIKNGIFPKIDLAVADIDINDIPSNMRAKFSVSGTKPIVEQIIEERSDITHWLAYFGRRIDLEESEQEVRKLFPEFKILKLYNGCGDANKIINEFEEYSGKVILMSVSMLLEGMHLNNVEGVLLYRNVGRTSTYFQIYGRLCKIGAEKSPLLLDVTNSVFNITDFNMFRSTRCRERELVYTKRDLFDITSSTYRYVELLDSVNPFKVKEYRGVKWTTFNSLAIALGKSSSGIRSYLSRKKGITIEDYIDMVLGDSTYEEYVDNGFMKSYTIKIAGKEYNYSSFYDLGVKLHHASLAIYDFSSFIKLVEWENNNGFIIDGEYRGINITSIKTVSDAIGIHHTKLRSFMSTEGVNVRECIDMWLDKDKWYRGIMLVDGVSRIHSITGVSCGEITRTFTRLGSMKDTIDKYFPETRIYRNIVITDNFSYKDIADQLGISVTAFTKYRIRNKSKGVEGWIDHYLDRTCTNYTDHEIKTILDCRNKGMTFAQIADILNSMDCNISRGIKRSVLSVNEKYNKLKDKVSDQ